MTYWKFIAFTPSYGIAGTSYYLQIGQINKTWTLRLMKDSTIVKQQLFGGDQFRSEKGLTPPNGCADSNFGIPDVDVMVAWVREVLPILMVNEVHIVNTIRGMRTMAEDACRKFKIRQYSNGKRESETIKLKHVDPSELDHHKVQGIVVENGTEERNYLLEQLHSLQGEIQKLKFENINLKEEVKLLRSANTRIRSL
ncbi:MAG: hypothetical protein EU530_01200 [Promethearchaeota archaeon]|nr:MAG: hypothetical protein EU530_01200 [Candidatus Lokiarchaeota archaeon]